MWVASSLAEGKIPLLEREQRSLFLGLIAVALQALGSSDPVPLLKDRMLQVKAAKSLLSSRPCWNAGSM